MADRPYHHGNLRAALLAQAEQTLREHGLDGLSLRELARQIGVSHGAPRRHFADRQALLDALAETGFARLGEQLRAAAESAGEDYEARLRATATGYVRFAIRDAALLTVEGDRHLELTLEGRRMATRVMRKHRLAERLLTDVIGLDWEDVHAEACRWEHVMSETVERRLVEILDHPTVSPYGNPIPGLDELGDEGRVEEFLDGVESLGSVVDGDEQRVVVGRIAEPIQTDATLMAVLRRVGALPGKVITVGRGAEDSQPLGRPGEGQDGLRLLA